MRTEPSAETSHTSALTVAPVASPMAVAAAFTRSASRLPMVTWQPSRASSMAMAWPSPPDAAATTARLPESPRSTTPG